MTDEESPYPAALLVVPLVYLAVVVATTWYSWQVNNHEDPELVGLIPMVLTLPTWVILYGIHQGLNVYVLFVLAAVIHVPLVWTPLWGPKLTGACGRILRARSQARSPH
ncbi:hypothetical protein OG216_45170 [Streptomycetaceae bacterium NBC_01309]